MIVTCPKCGRKGSLQRHHLANRRGELHYGVQHRMGGRRDTSTTCLERGPWR